MGDQKFELALHFEQNADLCIHLREPLPAEFNNRTYLLGLASQGTRHILQRSMEFKKLPHFGQSETNLMVAPDEQHTIQISLAVIPVPGGRPRRNWEQLLSLVETNSLDVNANGPG
jgi:hypothetical protein